MEINILIKKVEKKICDKIKCEKITIEDKTFLHKNHKTHKEGKFHIKINIKSKQLKELSKVESTKKIYSILHNELKIYIHSIQILIQ